MSQERVLIPPAELARRFSLSKFTVYKWIADGRIPVVRLGKSVRLDPDAVIAALRREGTADAN
jgi:excisionase family DNA binding protein